MPDPTILFCRHFGQEPERCCPACHGDIDRIPKPGPRLISFVERASHEWIEYKVIGEERCYAIVCCHVQTEHSLNMAQEWEAALRRKRDEDASLEVECGGGGGTLFEKG